MFEKEIAGKATVDTGTYVPNAESKNKTPLDASIFKIWEESESGKTGGGYAFDKATLREFAGEWEELSYICERARGHAEVIQRTNPPGKDYASVNMVDRLVATGNLTADMLDERQKFCSDMAEKFHAALGKYDVAEDEASTDVGKAGTDNQDGELR